MEFHTGWDPTHLWKSVCMQAARDAHFAVSLMGGTHAQS